MTLDAPHAASLDRGSPPQHPRPRVAGRKAGWTRPSVQPSLSLSFYRVYVYICIVKYINIHIGGLIEYISQKVAAYGQFVLVYTLTSLLYFSVSTITDYCGWLILSKRRDKSLCNRIPHIRCNYHFLEHFVFSLIFFGLC